ncbi:hypothetical protein Y032_0185g1040 [Ancylostoma ceylanicum]|uniref:Ig-like domain-containing protein n=1 Tax=Ancylostoma ceylanicum TaxID=53326 RepID=A0A016SRK8_9BILA|nr:hypothetical protein Y032_0185g1040 [Ancylostoma ceylanicum]
MRTFWGRKGKPITLPCTLPPPDDTNFSLEWRKDNKLIMSAYGDEAGHAAPSLQGWLHFCLIQDSLDKPTKHNRLFLIGYFTFDHMICMDWKRNHYFYTQHCYCQSRISYP